MLERLVRRFINKDSNPREVLFSDFKASSYPGGTAPQCGACDTTLYWKPDRYSFGQNGLLFAVPKIGWWRCPNGHPGKIYLPDLERFAARIDQHLILNSS